jgi:cold shock CspA family protein
VMSVGMLGGYDFTMGCWFIEPEDDGPRVFVHADDLAGSGEAVEPGLPVKFSVIQGVFDLKAYNITVLPAL